MQKEILLNGLKQYMQFEIDKYNDDYYKEVSDVINKLNSMNDLTREEKKFIRKCTSKNEISKYNYELSQIEENDYEQLINLRGRLIRELKQLEKSSSDINDKNHVRHNIIEELKKHKVVLQQYKTSKDQKIPITKKLGLTIKQVANTIDLFMEEKDVVNKAKTILKETIAGTTGAAALSLLIYGALAAFAPAVVAGKPVLDVLIKVAPSSAYIGLSSIIKNLMNKSQFEQFEYHMSDEYKALVDGFYKNHQEEMSELQTLMESKSVLMSREDKLELNGKIVGVFNDLIDKSKNVDGLREAFELQTLAILRENKDIRETIKNDYLEGRNNDTEKYKANNKELLKLNLSIFAKENSIVKAFEVAGGNMVKSTGVILMAKAILAAVAPATFPIAGIESISMPLLVTAINNLVDIPTYGNKLKYKEDPYTEEKDKKQISRIDHILEENRGAALA